MKTTRAIASFERNRIAGLSKAVNGGIYKAVIATTAIITILPLHIIITPQKIARRGESFSPIIFRDQDCNVYVVKEIQIDMRYIDNRRQ